MKNLGTKIFEAINFRDTLTKKVRQDQIILMSRTRIARNISGFRFNSISTKKEKKDILNIVKDVFYCSGCNRDYAFYNIGKLTETQRRFLLEKHILSPEMVLQLYGKGLILRLSSSYQEGAVSVMINEEDHLRMQSIMRGLSIYKTYKDVLKLEKMFEKKLSFCFDRDFGYLTSCPTNIGTSLRVSIITHLPAIVASGRIEDFVKNLTKIGCSIRGFFGENSEVVGNIFQVSNQMSLGKYEEQILDEMHAVCLNIIDAEKDATEYLKKTKPASVEDSVYRSYGMLKYARMLSYGESLELLSMIKLGQTLDILVNLNSFDFYQLISSLGESNIMLGEKNKISFNNVDDKADRIDKIRAEVIRGKILKGSDNNV
jgi:protein arginine kinase